MSSKRDLTVIDASQHEIRVTLWGDKAQANGHLYANQPVVAFRALKLSDYGGRSLGSATSSGIVFDPQCPEAGPIYNWKSQFHGAIPDGQSMSSVGAGSGDRSGSSDPIEKRKTFSGIQSEGLGLGKRKRKLFIIIL